MAENYSAQNSITIKRLRSNDSLMLTFENNGIPLFQAVDEESGAVSPDWSIAANQPVRTPKVTSAPWVGGQFVLVIVGLTMEWL